MAQNHLQRFSVQWVIGLVCFHPCSYFNPRFFFSMNTCASTGDAQMAHTYRFVVSLNSGSRVCLQFGHRTVSGKSSFRTAMVHSLFIGACFCSGVPGL
jgi:hypothetical protein